MRGTAHALYWRLHTAFLLNKRDEAKKSLAMLEFDELSNPVLAKEIGPIHYSRFELIRENVRNGNFGRLHGLGSQAPDMQPIVQPEDIPAEAEFHRILFAPTGKQKLLACLGIKRADMVHELNLGQYGRCDFLIRDGRAWHVVEVKMEEAKPAVISQVEKYRLALELDMIFGLHDSVNAIVLAQSFPPYVAGELARLSVQMVRHGGDADSLERVDGREVGAT